jgi:hypothetical protein
MTMRTVRLTISAWATPSREVLFKRDRPRAIDRYIDYFGDADARAASEDVVDVLLEASA